MGSKRYSINDVNVGYVDQKNTYNTREFITTRRVTLPACGKGFWGSG